MRPKGGGPRRKIWKASKDVWNPCNPLKSHKTAKALFGKAWSGTRGFWRSLEKGLEGAFIPPPLAPAASSLRSRWIVIARSEVARSEVAKQPKGREKEKYCSRFVPRTAREVDGKRSRPEMAPQRLEKIESA